MLVRIYRNLIGRFVFRKLTLGIGAAQLLVFVLIGLLTYYRFYGLLEERENDLLKIRTDLLREELADLITQFKRETIAVYPLSGDTPGYYSRFLPEGVPHTEEEAIAERKYFTGLQSYMLERNANVMSVLMYRSADGELFHKSRYPSAALDREFELAGLLASMPRTFEYPFIGRADGLYGNIDRPLLYLTNPLFDFSDIRNDNVTGYFMTIIDSRTLFAKFMPEGNRDGRVVILQSGVTLLDSREGEALREEGMLRASADIPQYGLSVVGMVSKASIQGRLSEIGLLIIGGLFAIWIVCMLLMHYILGFVIKRLRSMTQHFKRVQANPFAEPMERSGNDEIGDLIDRFNRMTRELQDYINRVYVADVQKSNAEYLALKMQINPHFLYNTLESLRMQAVVGKQPEMANKLFYLGRLYRWLLKTESEEIPVEEELRYTQYYLDLLLMGKTKQIELEAESQEDLRDCLMPKFSLQPIVENAILHGELEKADHPVIRLKIGREEETGARLIEIWNNGKGATLSEQAKLNDWLTAKHVIPTEHLGLKNIHERIRSYYGDPYGLFVNPLPPEKGFALTMKLPADSTPRGTQEHA
ncbi:sensor histidine kinase [Cohnella hongkongensis]|uniref:Sensor histidine kinase n=1 Tax=Cohnella hongkongensis TaxID=178337 RepID=A0ABV9FMI6_9BACL